MNLRTVAERRRFVILVIRDGTKAVLVVGSCCLVGIGDGTVLGFGGLKG